jgi:hypothetical protein
VSTIVSFGAAFTVAGAVAADLVAVVAIAESTFTGVSAKASVAKNIIKNGFNRMPRI